MAENDENEVVIMDDVDTDSAKDERAKGQLLKIFRKGGKQNRPSGLVWMKNTTEVCWLKWINYPGLFMIEASWMNSLKDAVLMT